MTTYTIELSEGSATELERLARDAGIPPERLLTTMIERWLAELAGEAWDRQIEEDAAAGKFDALAAEALAEYQAGKAIEL